MNIYVRVLNDDNNTPKGKKTLKFLHLDYYYIVIK